MIAKKFPIVVGLNRSQDASITIFHGNEHYGSIQKERLTHIKHDWGKVNDLSLYKKAFPFLHHPIDLIVECFSSDVEIKNEKLYIEEIENTFKLADGYQRIHISHHLAHLYSTLSASGYDRGAGLVIDFQGSYTKDIIEAYPPTSPPDGLEVASFYSFLGSNITCVHKHIWNGDRNHPEGLGIFYNFLSKCFYAGDGKEGKVMGLASHGKMMDLPDLEVEGGNVYIGREWIDIFKQTALYDFSANKKTFQEKADLAATGQMKFQQALLKITQWLHQTTQKKNLCYSGGCALNVITNSFIRQNSGFNSIFIPPAPGDGGTSIGCALYGLQHIIKKPSNFVWANDYLGPVQSIEHIEDIVKRYPSLTIDRPSNLEDRCAHLLHEGQVAALFQTRSEFGPRALGNRSIIADPRYGVTKFWINQFIKGREWYRPIAPVVLEEDAATYFELHDPSPFMLYTAQIKRKYERELEAIRHNDNSARVQTINEQMNPFLYRVIKNFKALSSIGIVLNTSFNLKGDTIVETVEEAIDSFYKKPIHCLIVPPYLITKKNPPENILQISDIHYD